MEAFRSKVTDTQHVLKQIDLLFKSAPDLSERFKRFMLPRLTGETIGSRDLNAKIAFSKASMFVDRVKASQKTL